VVHRPGDLLQLCRLDLAVDFFRLREHPAHHPHALPRGMIEKQPLDRPRIAREPRPHRRQPA